jgi:hypothetical protein
MVLRLLSDFKAGGIEFAGGGRAYCSTKNDGISERKFRHKSPANINFMALAWPRAVARVKKGGSRATQVIKNGPFSFLGCDPGRDFGSGLTRFFPSKYRFRGRT